MMHRPPPVEVVHPHHVVHPVHEVPHLPHPLGGPQVQGLAVLGGHPGGTHAAQLTSESSAHHPTTGRRSQERLPGGDSCLVGPHGHQ